LGFQQCLILVEFLSLLYFKGGSMDMKHFQVDTWMDFELDQSGSILENLKTPVMTVSKEMRIAYCNPAVSEILGRSIEEVTKIELPSLLPDFAKTRLYNALQKCFQTGDPVEVETGLGEKYIQAQIYPFSERLLVIFQDLTQRKRVENEMRQSMASLARSNAFIAALSQVAARIEIASDTDQVVEAMGFELSQLGIDCAVTLIEPETGDLIVRYTSIKPGIMSQIEALAGFSIKGLRLQKEFLDLLDGDQIEEARFFPDLTYYLTSLFHLFERDMLERIIRQIGIQPSIPVICLPIKGKENLIGHLSVWGAGLRPEDTPALSIFANQAGGMIEKVRLIEALERRSREAETLRQATAAVSSALDLDQVLERILIQLERVIPYHSAAVFLLEENRKRIVAARGFSNPDQVIGLTFDDEDPLLDEAGRCLSPVILGDAHTDERFDRWAHTDYVHGWMGVPLVARGELIGFLTIDSKQTDAFDESHAKLSQAFANEVAMAIDNARLFKETHRLSITDPLTGLYNRRHIYDEAQRELDRAQRYERSLSVIIFDLDRFKDVNDKFGHLAGDDVLRVMAHRCLDSLRHVERIGRYGGEEFVVFVPETDLKGACQVAERLRKAISETPIETRGQLVTVTASFGVAELNGSSGDIDKLLDRADQALYVAKRSGGNRVFADRESD
jgi:diguanylate cyclase (GGDEF)-like protein